MYIDQQKKKKLFGASSALHSPPFSDWNVLCVVSSGTPVWRQPGGLWGRRRRLEGGVVIDLGGVPVPFVPSHGADVQNYSLERKKNPKWKYIDTPYSLTIPTIVEVHLGWEKTAGLFSSCLHCFTVSGFMRARATVKPRQRQSVSKSVFHLRNIKQVGRDERLLNSEKCTLIYYSQPFQWCLCSVLKKKTEKKTPCVCLSGIVFTFCFLFRNLKGYVIYIKMLPLYLLHFDMCVLALL